MEQLIRIKHEQGMLEGMLKIPKLAKGLVLFAHGSGSSRLSPRNNFVADVLNKNNLATLLIDLLSKARLCTIFAIAKCGVIGQYRSLSSAFFYR